MLKTRLSIQTAALNNMVSQILETIGKDGREVQVGDYCLLGLKEFGRPEIQYSYHATMQVEQEQHYGLVEKFITINNYADNLIDFDAETYFTPSEESAQMHGFHKSTSCTAHIDFENLDIDAKKIERGDRSNIFLQVPILDGTHVNIHDGKCTLGKYYQGKEMCNNIPIALAMQNTYFIVSEQITLLKEICKIYGIGTSPDKSLESKV